MPVMSTTLQQRAGGVAIDAVGLRRLARRVPWPICVITGVAAALRVAHVSSVRPDEFYDAAVRSMSMSWHNFFFGAFDPGAILSIDKPPLDLWLQVASVKLFGWSQFALRLPEVLGGTLAVPLLYDAVRRVVGRPAALGAAATLAVLPESVLTSRSDTMDSLMMLLVVVALWLTIRAADRAERRALVLAGVALGLAFNVKLMEALIGIPALATFYVLASSRPRRQKLVDLAAAAGALVGISLSWAILASLAPGRAPWPVGSSDGSVWNAMFVFNGFAKASQTASTKPGGPGVFRLLVSTGWHYDLLFGCVLLAAVAIGVAAALRGIGERQRQRRLRRERAFAIALVVWIAVAVIVFDSMATLHSRYLDALAPALAAAVGYGAGVIAGLQGAGQAVSLRAALVALICICAYTFGLGRPSVAWGATALVLSVIGAFLVARAVPEGPLHRGAKWLLAGLIVACALVFPVHETLSVVRTNADDSLGLATQPAANVAALSNFLRPRTIGARYELAVDEPLGLAGLIIRDRRQILPLTSFAGRALTSVAELRSAVRSGEVRYALVGSYGCGPAHSGRAGCTPAALWIRRNGVDITGVVGLTGWSHLYLLRADLAA